MGGSKCTRIIEIGRGVWICSSAPGPGRTLSRIQDIYEMISVGIIATLVNIIYLP